MDFEAIQFLASAGSNLQEALDYTKDETDKFISQAIEAITKAILMQVADKTPEDDNE